MAAPIAAAAVAAAPNLPNKMSVLLFSPDFGRGGSVKAVPLEQIPKVKHRYPSANQARVSPKTGCRQGLARDAYRQDGVSHTGEWVVIAAKCGHNRASHRHFPLHDPHLRRFSSWPPRHLWPAPCHARGDFGLRGRVRSTADASRRGGRKAHDAAGAFRIGLAPLLA